MTRSLDEVIACLELRRGGSAIREISRETGVPSGTIKDWVRGVVPEVGQQHRRGCRACGHHRHAWDELPAVYAYVLGMYLGDGCLSAHARGFYRLRVSLDSRYPAVIDEVAAAITEIVPRNRVGRIDRRGWVVVNAYSRSWPCFFPQHGPGRKHQRPIVLTDWQQDLVRRHPRLLLRGLLHSDGCRFENTGRGGWSSPRYSFTNMSADIRGIFVQACGLLDLHTTWSPPKTIYVSRKADVARLDEFVGPKT